MKNISDLSPTEIDAHFLRCSFDIARRAHVSGQRSEILAHAADEVGVQAAGVSADPERHGETLERA